MTLISSIVERYRLYLIRKVKWPLCNTFLDVSQHIILKIRWISTYYRKDNVFYESDDFQVFSYSYKSEEILKLTDYKTVCMFLKHIQWILLSLTLTFSSFKVLFLWHLRHFSLSDFHFVFTTTYFSEREDV